jgi:hypothetical protein
MTHRPPRVLKFTYRLTLRLTLRVFLVGLLLIAVLPSSDARGQKRRAANAGGGSGRAVVIDERLSALRSEPELSAPLLQRLSHGREVTITGTRRASDGVVFSRVAVTRRTRGWVQAESLALVRRAGEDERLLRLARATEGFERIERLRLFLEFFPTSKSRPQALLLIGDAAEAATERLTRDALRRLNVETSKANPAPPHSFMLNFQGLDRFNRAGLHFVFDKAANRFRYDGASWREILRRHPQSAEAATARERLEKLPR